MSAIRRSVPPENIPQALSEIMTDWAEDGEKKLVQAIDDAAQACNDTAEEYLYEGHGLNTGQYRSSFAIEKEWKGRHRYSATWHVKEPHYRLTHLLENGHLTRDGTHRTKAIKHIRYGRQIAEKVLGEKIKGIWGG